MIGLADIASRFTTRAARAPGAVVALLPYFTNWKATMEKIDNQIAEVRARRNQLIEQRDAATAAGVEGDSEAAKRADALDRQVDDADRELSRLGAARGKAAARVAAEEGADAAQAERTRLASIRAAVAKWRAKAEAVQALVADTAAALKELHAAGIEAFKLVQHADARNLLADFQIAVPHVVDDALAASGFRFRQMALLDPERKRPLAAHVPLEEAVINIALDTKANAA